MSTRNTLKLAQEILDFLPTMRLPAPLLAALPVELRDVIRVEVQSPTNPNQWGQVVMSKAYGEALGNPANRGPVLGTLSTLAVMLFGQIAAKVAEAGISDVVSVSIRAQDLVPGADRKTVIVPRLHVLFNGKELTGLKWPRITTATTAVAAPISEQIALACSRYIEAGATDDQQMEVGELLVKLGDSNPMALAQINKRITALQATGTVVSEPTADETDAEVPNIG